MKLIHPSVEILSQEPGISGMYKHIEIAGRTCYKSENLITPDSAKDFVQRLINNNHTAMLEHGTVYLTIPSKTWRNDNEYFTYLFPKDLPWIRIVQTESNFCVTTNFRHIHNKGIDIEILKRYLRVPETQHKKRVTVRFICDRGVSHELVRHRVFSFAQESTRYCNYSKDKFGNQITYIIPSWEDISEEDANAMQGFIAMGLEFNEQGERVRPFYLSLISAEAMYQKMIENGYNAQQARQVLPNALKTELVMTGFVDDWKNFFELRCAQNAHPDMRFLANQLKGKFTNSHLL